MRVFAGQRTFFDLVRLFMWIVGVLRDVELEQNWSTVNSVAKWGQRSAPARWYQAGELARRVYTDPGASLALTGLRPAG